MDGWKANFIEQNIMVKKKNTSKTIPEPQRSDSILWAYDPIDSSSLPSSLLKIIRFLRTHFEIHWFLSHLSGIDRCFSSHRPRLFSEWRRCATSARYIKTSSISTWVTSLRCWIRPMSFGGKGSWMGSLGCFPQAPQNDCEETQLVVLYYTCTHSDLACRCTCPQLRVSKP